MLVLNLQRSASDTSKMQCFLFVCASCFHAIAKPYKLNFMNNVDIVILFLLETLTFATSTLNSRYLTYLILGTTLLLLAPHMVLIFYIFHKLAQKTGITEYLKRKYKALKRCIEAARHTGQAEAGQAEADVEAQSDTDSLPDRLINPGEYEPVLPTIEEHAPADPTSESKEPVIEELRRLTPVYTYGSIS